MSLRSIAYARWQLSKLWFIAILCWAATGCISTSLSEVDVEPGFDWDTLKRDQIVMTPLMDLRSEGGPSDGQRKDLQFFGDKERLAYPEKFKQEFFELRKDIRVFGAGGAFEHVAQVPGLQGIAAKVFAKEPLPPGEVTQLTSGMQDIRFLFFFAVTSESLTYDFQYVFRRDQEMDVKRYSARRNMTVRLALWDSKSNKTVWIGTQRLSPTDSSSYDVRNPTKRKKKEGNSFVWVGSPERTSLSEELARNRSRFPSFPGREPSFSASFDDFALGLPIQPSEAKLIEYTHFTYHRPELALRTAAQGKDIVPSLQLGTSSVINYNLRFGAALAFPLGDAEVKRDGRTYTVAGSSYGLTFDYEWTLSPRSRLLTGLMAGGAVFVIDDEDAKTSASAEDGEEDESTSVTDGTLFVAPRVFLLFGDKGGFQWGVGGAARFFDGIEEPVLKAARPSPWSLDLSVAYAFRGF